MISVDILAFIFQLCGLAPYTQKTKAYRTICTLITTTLSALAIGMINYYGIEYLIFSAKNNLERISGIWIYFLFTVNAIVVILESLGKRDRHLTILQSFNSIDDLYRVKFTLSKRIHCERISKRFPFKTLASLILYVLLKIAFVARLPLVDEWSIYWLRLMYPMALISLRTIQFVFYVD